MGKKAVNKKKILEHIFDRVAPGTALREAIDKIQEAKLGALIVLGNPNDLKDVMGGGFELNTVYSPQKVYELSKMDGGIILSEDIKTIYGANIQLQPNYSIETDESGTRHQAAHRIAQQKGNLVVAVSERRNKITVYYGKFRYLLNEIGDLLTKSSQAITALEKYSLAIEKNHVNLSILEFDNMVTLYDIVECVRMYGLLFRMSEELIEYMAELGSEGRLIKIQYEEIMLNKNESFDALIKDYKISNETAEKIGLRVKSLTKEELLDDEKIVCLLGFDTNIINLDEKIEPRGYGLLSNITKISKKDREILVREFSNVQSILMSTASDIAKIKGVSKYKAEHINKSLKRIKNRTVIDRE